MNSISLRSIKKDVGAPVLLQKLYPWLDLLKNIDEASVIIFVLFKEHEKHPWMNLTLSKIEEWCQIAQNISFYFGSWMPQKNYDGIWNI